MKYGVIYEVNKRTNIIIKVIFSEAHHLKSTFEALDIGQ